MPALAADLAHALDPAAFAEGALGFRPDDWQRRALRSTGRRQVWNCCRQSGKSTTAAILGLHRAVFHPDSLSLVVSPSQRQSGELFRKVTGLLNRLPMPPSRTEDNKLSLTLANGSRVVSLPSSEATVRGYSKVDLVIFDESSRVDDALYRALRPTLATSDGQLILMSTPWGKRGHFYAEWSEGGPAWERIKITAPDCPRISAAFLEEERRSMGPLFYAGEYLGEFVETEDSVFRHDDIQAALDPAVLPLFPLGGIAA